MGIESPLHIVAASAFVRNENGHILLIKHPVRGWELPGGRVENGENLIEAVKREVEEESGVTMANIKLIGIYSNVAPTSTAQHTKIIFNFKADYAGGELKTSDESLEVKWFDESRVLGNIPGDTMQLRVKDSLLCSGEIVYRAFSAEPLTVKVSTIV